MGSVMGRAAKRTGEAVRPRGRPSTGRKKIEYYVTDEEDVKIRKLIELMRKKSV